MARRNLLLGALFVGLLALALGLFALAEKLAGGSLNPWVWIDRLQSGVATDRVASAAEVVAGVLAVAITVVAIIVELAAQRYTHRITQLFVREPLNIAVLSLFVLTTILCVWVSTAPVTADAEAALPQAPLLLAIGMVTVCLLLLIPYFGFVFEFLSPVNVVERIRGQAVRSIRRARSRVRSGMQAAVIGSMEELEDIAHGAQEHGDRVISLEAIGALAELLRDYVAVRDQLPEAWFQVEPLLSRDPDFVSLDPSAMEEIIEERIWLESKLLRQYLTVFSDSLGGSRDITNLIALNTRRIGSEAAASHPALLTHAVRSFNSYLRAAVNRRDVRAAYYVLHQYRLLGDAVLARGRGAVALEIASHLRLYGMLAFGMGLPFLLEVAAYEFAVLVENAVVAGRAEADPLLDLFLELDRDSPDVSGDVANRAERPALALRGVRRSQVQLAAFFLARGDEANARRIHLDMADESTALLAAVRDELTNEERALYWEIEELGVNFSYLAPERRVHLPEFFAWFGERLAAGDGAGDRGRRVTPGA